MIVHEFRVRLERNPYHGIGLYRVSEERYLLLGFIPIWVRRTWEKID